MGIYDRTRDTYTQRLSEAPGSGTHAIVTVVVSKCRNGIDLDVSCVAHTAARVEPHYMPLPPPSLLRVFDRHWDTLQRTLAMASNISTLGLHKQTQCFSRGL